jgi:hypothetical protein
MEIIKKNSRVIIILLIICFHVFEFVFVCNFNLETSSFFSKSFPFLFLFIME